MWVVTNRPSGNAMVSWWAKKKDKLTGETKVTVTLDNGTVISRVKSSTLNGYIINDKVLEAVGTEVPQEIVEALNMSDVNYAGQMDAPYLISESAGYVATYLNDIVDLGDADFYQSTVEGMRRKNNTEITTTEAKIKEATVPEGTYDWIEKAGVILQNITESEERKYGLAAKTQFLDDTISIFGDTSDKLSHYDSILYKAKDYIEKIDKLAVASTMLEKETLELTSLIGAHAKYLTDTQNSGIIEASQGLIKKIGRFSEVCQENKDVYKSIQGCIEKYTQLQDAMETDRRALEEAEASLGSTCPLCGNRLHTIESTF